MNKSIQLLKDPKFYLENFCKIKTKEQGMQPFILNEAQKHFYNQLKNTNRAIILKARQIGFCLDPETRILFPDGGSRKLDDIKIGDKISAVHENRQEDGRRMNITTVVEAKWDVFEDAFSITLKDGTNLIATADHRFLFGSGEWEKVRHIRMTDKIVKYDSKGKYVDLRGAQKIVSMEYIGKRRMIDLQTSEKTFIANGYVSHNSTAATGYLYHKTITTPGTTTALIGYNSDLTAELLDKVKTFYRTTPEPLRPTIQYNTKYEITFPKIDSKILVLPSTDNVGRGYTLNFALLTELAFWEKAEEKMTALESSIPANGLIIVESTPNGVGNQYHRMWMSDNDYTKLEYGWWWLYTEEEIEVIRKRMNNPQRFAQEYELEFLTAGRPVFDPSSVKKQRRNILSVGDENSDGKKVYIDKNNVRIYREPQHGHKYVISADTSEGVQGGDYSVAIVLDRETGEEVAMFRGLIAPDKFGVLLDELGRYYNNGLMIVEINNHGLTVITILKQKMYPTIYFRPAQFETIATSWSDKIGWKTNKVTRPLLIDDLAQAMRDNLITIRSKEILDEMLVFVYDKANNAVAQHGYHDDCIMSLGIGYQGFKVLYSGQLTQLDYAGHLPSSFAY